MTTEIDLLPMPKPEGSGLYRAWSYDQMRDYARANVARAVAPLQAEIDALRTRLEDTVRDSTDKIKALRAEVAEAREFRDKLAKAIGNEQLRMFIEKHGEPVPLTIRMQEAEARAERLEAEVERVTCELMDAITRADKLEEALRELVEVFSESGMYDEEVFDKARAALGKESKR